MIKTAHLILFPDTGSVYLRVEDGDDEFMGHIDDPDACPWEHRREWDWLVTEMADRRAFGDACRRTAEASYHDAIGTMK